QVNTHALIASSADIDDGRFLANGIYSSLSNNSYLPNFKDAGGLVKVEAGADIETNAPSSVTTGGGFVMLLGSEGKNDGTISTPKGQVLLAAGGDFILRPGYGTDANQISTTRGNEVRALINSPSNAGVVTNSGLLFAQQGDVTLTGRTISQEGVALSTTS